MECTQQTTCSMEASIMGCRNSNYSRTRTYHYWVDKYWYDHCQLKRVSIHESNDTPSHGLKRRSHSLDLGFAPENSSWQTSRHRAPQERSWHLAPTLPLCLKPVNSNANENSSFLSPNSSRQISAQITHAFVREYRMGIYTVGKLCERSPQIGRVPERPDSTTTANFLVTTEKKFVKFDTI
eukprot:scaffold246021_cov18-Prasinocladus_malaysianus.AAC.1